MFGCSSPQLERVVGLPWSRPLHPFKKNFPTIYYFKIFIKNIFNSIKTRRRNDTHTKWERSRLKENWQPIEIVSVALFPLSLSRFVPSIWLDFVLVFFFLFLSLCGQLVAFDETRDQSQKDDHVGPWVLALHHYFLSSCLFSLKLFYCSLSLDCFFLMISASFYAYCAKRSVLLIFEKSCILLHGCQITSLILATFPNDSCESEATFLRSLEGRLICILCAVFLKKKRERMREFISAIRDRWTGNCTLSICLADGADRLMACKLASAWKATENN